MQQELKLFDTAAWIADLLSKMTIDGAEGRYRVKLSENGQYIANKRYLADGDNDMKDVFKRVARKLALQDVKYLLRRGSTRGTINGIVSKRFEEYFWAMAKLQFIPGGRTLANVDYSVPNCIVLHFEDSLQGIFHTLGQAVQLQKAGAGLGFPFHLLRPTGTKSADGLTESSGPVSFLHVYDAAFGVIKQQNRHGT